MKEETFPLIIAHAGGAAHTPENTLAAFRRGLAENVDGFEFDVHLSKDGKPVVIHDFSLERVAGIRVPVAALTAQELGAIDVGSWFSPDFSDQMIPTLEDVLMLLKGRRLLLNIEIKAGYRLYPGIEEKCLYLVENLDGNSKVIFSSFDHYSLRRFKELDKKVITGALHSCSLIDAHEYAARIGVDALHPQYIVVDGEYIAGCRTKNITVNTWTVNDPDQARKLWAMGVDCIISDDPLKIRNGINDMKGDQQ